MQHVIILMAANGAWDRSEFRAHFDLNKKDFGTIEYLLRRGRRQLDTYREEGIRDVLR
jgi:succinate dehydrogenase assembly factor 1